ncbi:hypothetical protein K456DRAFT_1704993 [Colletotrichum gloeosporioides 23]|nr:hypothetical protein K456DRAFT_1704993 [Colletotrichum gloeosporioides 23]
MPATPHHSADSAAVSTHTRRPSSSAPPLFTAPRLHLRRKVPRPSPNIPGRCAVQRVEKWTKEHELATVETAPKSPPPALQMITMQSLGWRMMLRVQASRFAWVSLQLVDTRNTCHPLAHRLTRKTALSRVLRTTVHCTFKQCFETRTLLRLTAADCFSSPRPINLSNRHQCQVHGPSRAASMPPSRWLLGTSLTAPCYPAGTPNLLQIRNLIFAMCSLRRFVAL